MSVPPFPLGVGVDTLNSFDFIAPDQRIRTPSPRTTLTGFRDLRQEFAEVLSTQRMNSKRSGVYCSKVHLGRIRRYLEIFTGLPRAVERPYCCTGALCTEPSSRDGS